MQTYTYISEGNFGIVEKEKPYNSNLGGIKMDRFKKSLSTRCCGCD